MNKPAHNKRFGVSIESVVEKVSRSEKVVQPDNLSRSDNVLHKDK